MPGEAGARRSLWRSIAVGVGVGLVGFSVGLLLVAMPLFGLARAIESGRGLGRPFIRDNLLGLTLPVGTLCGLIAGTVAGRWYRRGGRIPTE